MDLSNSAINRIGDIIRQGSNAARYDEAIETLNAWRESHGELMDEYYEKCVRLTQSNSTKNIIVAQRLKRLPTIVDKLNRFKGMKLARMQDVAGVRLIVRDMEQLSQIEKHLRRWRHLMWVRDYIGNPKIDGYRGKHFIFKKNGMYVEVQLRTQVQHIWATSVETVDVFRGSSIKTNGSSTYWRDFFRQTSSALAIAERAVMVKGFENMSLKETCEVIGETMRKHKIGQSLQAIEISGQTYVMMNRTRDAYYLVLDLDFKKKVCRISSFKENEYNLAVEEYKKLEHNMKRNNSIVLVSVSDMKKLNDAYPNYFLNLRYFNELIGFLLEKNKKRG